MVFILFFLVFFLFFMMFILSSVCIVNQAEVILIERFGQFKRVLKSGIHFVLPFADKPRRVLWTFVKEDRSGRMYRYVEQRDRIDLRETVDEFPKQNVITKDNVTMEISALLYYQVTDPIAGVYEVNNLPQAIEKLTQTTLRNIIGAMDLDETLTSRDQINHKLRDILDEATEKWGLKVNRVELQEVNPPHDIRVAMEKQMRAERDRRALILEAEGQKQAAILESEGRKQAAILDAEGERMSKITRAEGESEARRLIAQAESDAIVMIQKSVPGSDPLPYMVALNYLRVLPQMLEGQDNKVIMVPYETSGVLGSLTSIKEIFKK